MACTSNESSAIHQPLKPALTLYQNPNQLTINVDLNENFKLLDFCRVFRESIRNVASNYRRQLIICWLKSDVRKSILWHLSENVYHYFYLNSTLHNISLLRQVEPIVHHCFNVKNVRLDNSTHHTVYLVHMKNIYLVVDEIVDNCWPHYGRATGR